MQNHPPKIGDQQAENYQFELLEIMDSSDKSHLNYNDFALRLFDYQFKQNAPYQNYCLSLNRTPENIDSWKSIPAVPTDAFKLHQLPLSTFPKKERLRTFYTSGTTGELRGHHHFPSLELYERSILAGWKQLHLPLPSQARAIYLTAPGKEAPHSSLSHMMEVLDGCRDQPSVWSLDPNEIVTAIQQAIGFNQPVALLGTALAFLHLFESMPKPLMLPTGSWAMETGGYKGSQRSLSKEDLYELFYQQLQIPTDSVINEYSMTELSSQFYSRGLANAHTGPKWLRSRVINPHTQMEVAPGEAGHLAIYDLANIYSVMAIQTQDIAIRNQDNSFTLVGRDPHAIPRGCSRAADAQINTAASIDEPIHSTLQTTNSHDYPG